MKSVYEYFTGMQESLESGEAKLYVGGVRIKYVKEKLIGTYRGVSIIKEGYWK